MNTTNGLSHERLCTLVSLHGHECFCDSIRTFHVLLFSHLVVLLSLDKHALLVHTRTHTHTHTVLYSACTALYIILYVCTVYINTVCTVYINTVCITMCVLCVSSFTCTCTVSITCLLHVHGYMIVLFLLVCMYGCTCTCTHRLWLLSACAYDSKR